MTAVTAAQSTPRPLAAYLRRATWGLSAARRQELWNELEEHLLTRADHLCAFGTPYELALAQAISEMGPPAKVSAGMTEVYLMPKILISAGAAALALGAVFFALAGGGALLSVPGLTAKLAAPVCLNNSAAAQMDKNALALQQAACDALITGGTQAELAVVGLNDLKKVFNDNGIDARLTSLGDLEVRYAPGVTRVLTKQLNIGGKGYTQASNLIASVLDSTLTPVLKVSGFNNPVLDFEKFKLQLGNLDRPVDGMSFYQDLAPIFLLALKEHLNSKTWTLSYTRFDGGSAPVKHVIQTKLKPGEVVMMASQIKSSVVTESDIFSGDVALVAQDGTVTLRSYQAHLRFVSTLSQLSPQASDGRVNALLLRVTNIPLRNLKSGILTPAQPTSDAR
jgi:hypothetical protein